MIANAWDGTWFLLPQQHFSKREGNRKMGYKNMMGLQPHLSRVTFTEITSRTTLFFCLSLTNSSTLKDYTYRGCWKSMVHSIFWAYSVESSGNRITISYGACSRVQYLMVFLYSHWNECIVFLCFKRLTKGQKIRHYSETPTLKLHIEKRDDKKGGSSGKYSSVIWLTWPLDSTLKKNLERFSEEDCNVYLLGDFCQYSAVF